MPNTTDVTRAPIVVTGLLDTKCFTTWQDFIKDLPDLIAAEVPNSITNVIISNVQPSSSQTTSIWFRLSNDGSFLGLYVFSAGAWHQIYPVNVDTPVVTTQIFWLFGDSSQPPAGFTNTDSFTGLSVAVQTALKAMWVLEGTTYTYYSAVFSGF